MPESEHALDQLTMDQLRRWVFVEQPPTPQFAFVNLGDIDRSGHIDPTGNAVDGEYPAGRSGAMLDTDALIGTFVDGLKAQGWWDDTVLIVASDHGMDYSLPDAYVDFPAAFAGAGLSVGFDLANDDVGISENGGAALVYVHDVAKRDEVRAVLDNLDGVDLVLSRDAPPHLADYGLDHPRAGDFVALVEPGRRVASGNFGSSNPIPGNHGHAITQHSVLMVTGGHDAVAEPSSVAGPPVYEAGSVHRAESGPGNLSIAPTVNALFGLAPPAGGYDGQPLTDAFTSLDSQLCVAAGGGG
ncbi:MAG TPA: alkaline phosphatase family protein, partial [Egibacteraceae bacterium]|nr:alkaline phosphatase family protein [Egibacteraceae bacterium]